MSKRKIQTIKSKDSEKNKNKKIVLKKKRKVNNKKSNVDDFDEKNVDDNLQLTLNENDFDEKNNETNFDDLLDLNDELNNLDFNDDLDFDLNEDKEQLSNNTITIHIKYAKSFFDLINILNHVLKNTMDTNVDVTMKLTKKKGDANYSLIFCNNDIRYILIRGNIKVEKIEGKLTDQNKQWCLQTKFISNQFNYLTGLKIVNTGETIKLIRTREFYSQISVLNLVDGNLSIKDAFNRPNDLPKYEIALDRGNLLGTLKQILGNGYDAITIKLDLIEKNSTTYCRTTFGSFTHSGKGDTLNVSEKMTLWGIFQKGKNHGEINEIGINSGDDNSNDDMRTIKTIDNKSKFKCVIDNSYGLQMFKSLVTAISSTIFRFKINDEGQIFVKWEPIDNPENGMKTGAIDIILGPLSKNKT